MRNPPPALLFFLAALLACGGTRAGLTDAEPKARAPAPASGRVSNVLLVVAADVGVDKVAAYGEHPSPPHTPNIDRLARDGVLFRNAYSYAVCSPTRASYLTGRHAFRTGIGTIVDSWTDQYELAPDEITIPEMLERADAGWATSLAGKWHLGSSASGPVPTHAGRQGFDWYAGSMGNLKDKWPEKSGDRWGYTLWNKNTNGEVELTRAYPTTDTVDDALARIAAMPEPWFLLVSFNAPHRPLHLPPDDLHSRKGVTEGSDPADKFDAMLEALDSELGRLIREADTEVMGRTTLIFLGDNGTPDHAIRAPWDPKRSKRSLFEGGVNVPMIVTGPQVSKGGAETTALVHTVDIFATVAEIAGVDVNKLGRPIDGVSFLPHIIDPGRASTRDTVYTAKHLPNGMGPYEESGAMIRDQQFKLVVDHTDGTEAEGLYELQNGSGLEGPNLLRGKKGVPPNAQRAYEKLKAELKRIEGSLRPDP
jgi:arylsulfatase A-like enzyme